MNNCTIEFEVGLLLRGQVRKYLDRVEFVDGGIKWKEIKSFLTSTFIVHGSANALIAIKQHFEEAMDKHD